MDRNHLKKTQTGKNLKNKKNISPKKTAIKKRKLHFLKLGILFFGISLLLWNCSDENKTCFSFRFFRKCW